jgi:hypothetical protein
MSVYYATLNNENLVVSISNTPPANTDNVVEISHELAHTPSYLIMDANTSTIRVTTDEEADYHHKKLSETAVTTNVRVQRNDRLRQSDWTQMPDVTLDPIPKAAWATYRQALRDITKQPGFPFTIEWPTSPW